jgi:hypothetical protein
VNSAHTSSSTMFNGSEEAPRVRVIKNITMMTPLSESNR